jgi:1-acyl-sn-glycerol-3-phosphate acyltransferase
MRALLTGAFFFTMTPLLISIQWLLGKLGLPGWGFIATRYYRVLCKILGIGIRVDGQPIRDHAVLFVSNHVSWADILIIGSIMPIAFVSKAEVGNWPLVGTTARLQRTVFVDRSRRQQTGDAIAEMVSRLADGVSVVLFAEGTSSDGNRVLPFKTSLFAAAKPTAKAGAEPVADTGVVVQTLSLVYTRLHGVPFNRSGRPLVGWYGDMEMQSHAWALLKAGPLDVRIRIGEPIPLEAFADRKDLARRSEDEVRKNVVRLLRGYADDVAISATRPATRPRTSPQAARSGALFR